MKLAATLLALLAVLSAAPSAHAEILDIKEVTSPGGIKAWLVEDHTIPVISLKLAFKDSGAVNDPADKQGLSRLLSNTLDEGAGSLDSKAFQQELTDLSISLSFSASRDDFYGEVKTLSANRDRAFELLGLALTQPRFDEDAVDRMREANLTRIRSDMTDPKWMAARLLNAHLFGDHPYAMNSGGTLSSFSRITSDDLRKKVKDELTRDRLVVSVAGDIGEHDLGTLLDKTFSSLPASSVKLDIDKASWPQASQTVLYKKDIPQTVIQIAMPGIDIKDPDYFAAEIMNFVFGGAGFGSRLMESIREKRGLTYGVYSGMTDMNYAEIMAIHSSTKNETVDDLIELAMDEAARLRDSDISPQELGNARTYLIGSVPLDLTSTDRIAGYMLGFQMQGLPRNYLDIREKGLKSVTAADVRRVAGEMLRRDLMTVILVGSPTRVKPTVTVDTLPDVE